MSSYEVVPARACCKCERWFSSEEISGANAWTPLRAGWRCPTCTRERWARINKLATSLRTTHHRYDWAGQPEHREYDECVFCEVLGVATELALCAERIPGAPARTRDAHRYTAGGPRSCCKCGRSFDEKERHSEHRAWMPLRSGWRCSECTIEYHTMTRRIAETLVASHRQRAWLGLAEHSSWDECVFCEVLTVATELALGGHRGSSVSS
jgi:hypothetical protein